MIMPDFNVDFSKLLSKERFLTFLASVALAICYFLFCSDNRLVSVLVFCVSFVVIELVVKIVKKTHDKLKKLSIKRKKQNENVIYFAMEALTFFRTMTKEQKDLAVSIVKYPQIKNSLQNERYLDSRENNAYDILSKFETLKTSSHNLMYIEDDSDRKPRTPIKHVIIDPLFYAILEHYSETNEEYFPKNIKMKKYREYYEDGVRFY